MRDVQFPIRVELGPRSYDIRFYESDPEAVARDVRPFCPERPFVVSNETIWKLHGDRFQAALRASGMDPLIALVGDGEKYKTLDSASALYDELIAARCSRSTCIVAFGGGVIGDLAGFVAATFLRGVNFVQVPTTVLSMVDSSVGGKTGVDHPMGKNLIGAFYQPKLVTIDVAYLDTLDAHNLHGGFAEVIKYGVIRDPEFFEYLETHVADAIARKRNVLKQCIGRSCEIKADVVSRDETEGDLRAILNFGHTFAHAIETAAVYRERQFHGQAVAIGMVAASELAVELGHLDPGDAKRIRSLIERAGLPTSIPADLTPAELLDRMQSDKKVQRGKLRFVLPHRIGQVEMHSDVPQDALTAVIERCKAAA